MGILGGSTQQPFFHRPDGSYNRDGGKRSREGDGEGGGNLENKKKKETVSTLGDNDGTEDLQKRQVRLQSVDEKDYLTELENQPKDHFDNSVQELCKIMTPIQKRKRSLTQVIEEEEAEGRGEGRGEDGMKKLSKQDVGIGEPVKTK